MDPRDAFWDAVTRAARLPIDTVVEVLGGTRSIAQRLGISQRQAQRYVRATREGRTVRSANFAAFSALSRTAPETRRAALGRRRAARMTHHGAHVRWKGNGGVFTDPRPDFRDRIAEADLSAESMQRIMEAWESGDDEATMRALQDAFDEDYVAGFQINSIDELSFDRHRW